MKCDLSSTVVDRRRYNHADAAERIALNRRPLATRLLDPALEAESEGEQRWFLHGGAIAERVAKHDWSETPLGPLGHWPDTLRTVVNVMLGSSHPMFVVWGEAQTLLYNKQYAAIIAHRHPEALGRPMFDRCRELEADLAPILDSAFAGQPSHVTDFRMRLHQQQGTSDRRFDLSATPVRDSSGRVLGVLCTCVDVTARRQAEWETEAARDLAQKTLDTIREPMIVLHDDLRVMSANQAFYETFQAAPEDTEGRLIYELGNNQWDIPRLRELLERILPEQEVFNEFEVEHEFERIGTRTMLLNARRIDHLQLILLAIEDVTERRRAEQSLKANERLFRLMADQAPVMIWVSDDQGRCTYVNRRWYEFTGRTSETPPKDVPNGAFHPDDEQRAEATFAVARANREPFQLECRLRRSDGAYRWVIAAASPRIDDHGRFHGFVGSILDITDRKHDEQKMKLIMDELNHRVKNTLAVVSSMAEQTYRHADSAEQFRAAFFERLKSLAKAHGLLTQMQWEGARIDELLRVELEPRVHEDWQLALAGPPVVLEPNAALALHMMVHELSTNASKYGALSSPHGRIDVQWRCMPSVDDCRELALHWSESGGPAVDPPQRNGFGTRVLKHTARFELDGEAHIRYEPEGLQCTIRFPHTAGAKVQRPEGTDEHE